MGASYEEEMTELWLQGMCVGERESARINFLYISLVNSCLFSDMSHFTCILACVLYICLLKLSRFATV